MPALQNSAHQQLRADLIENIQNQQHRIRTDYPQTWNLLKQSRPDLTQNSFEIPTPEISSQQNLVQDLKPNLVSLSIEVSGEEHAQILRKLAALAQAPVGGANLPDQLYFEQQLGDMLGLTVTAELDGYRLPYTVAHAQALPHFPTHPNDQLSAHQPKEAGLSSTRSTFGWLSDKTHQYEKFGVALPLHKLPDWPKRRLDYVQWFKYRKVILINPTQQTAAVGVVTQIGPAYVQRFQVGLSPELIRLTKAWHPDSKGKMVIFLLDDSAGSVKLGQINLASRLKKEPSDL